MPLLSYWWGDSLIYGTIIAVYYNVNKITMEYSWLELVIGGVMLLGLGASGFELFRFKKGEKHRTLIILLGLIVFGVGYYFSYINGWTALN